MIPTLEKIIRRRSGQILLPLMVSALSPRASIGPIARAAVSWQSPGDSTMERAGGGSARVSRPRRLLDRRSPAGLGVGDLRSAKWQGQETLPLGPIARAAVSCKPRRFRSVHQAQRSGQEIPRAVNHSEAVALAALPLPSVGFPTFGSRYWSRIIFAVAPVIAASSQCVDDDFLILIRIRRGVNSGYTRCVERPSIIEAGRNLIDNVLDFHEDFITNGNC